MIQHPESTYYYTCRVHDFASGHTCDVGSTFVWRESADMMNALQAALREEYGEPGGAPDRSLEPWLSMLEDKWRSTLRRGGYYLVDEVTDILSVDLRKLRVYDPGLDTSVEDALTAMSNLGKGVGRRHDIWDRDDRLNEVLDISRDIPMSLDEWDHQLHRWRRS